MKNNKKHYSLFIVIAAILWAFDGVLRRSLYSLPPVTIVFYEHLIGAFIITPLFLYSLKKPLKKILTKRVIGLTMVVALLSGLLGTLFFTSALMKVNFIPFSVVILLQKLQPIFAIVAASIFLKEKITKDYIIWASLALISAYFLTFPYGIANLSTGSGTLLAAALALGAAIMWGSSTVFSKLLLKEVTYTQATGLRFYATSVFALLAVFVLGQQASLNQVVPTDVLRLVTIVLSTGMVAMLLYYKGLQHTQAKVATILELIFPLLAVGIDVVLFNNVLFPIQYFAGFVMILAMYRVSLLNVDDSSQD